MFHCRDPNVLYIEQSPLTLIPAGPIGPMAPAGPGGP